MLATYRSYGVCEANLAVYAGNLGNLHVLWAVLAPVWGFTSATYKSYGVCWGHFGAVGRQPTGLMGCVRATLGLYAGNLHVLWGVELGLGLYVGNLGNLHVLRAVCWQPRLLWCVLEPVWGCMLATYATYMSSGVCWGQFRAVCWQPTSLMGCVEPVWGCMLAT